MDSKYIKLRNCPFCGCDVTLTNNRFIDGTHDAECFFYFVDNQRNIDFRETENFAKLVEAWNRRACKTRRKV